MDESINKIEEIIDKLVEEFKYVSDVCLDLAEVLPEDIVRDFEKKIENVRRIYQEYWLDWDDTRDLVGIGKNEAQIRNEMSDSFCCDDFSDAIEERKIWFDEHKDDSRRYYFEYVEYQNNWRDHDGYDTYEIIADPEKVYIQYCPFCGEEVQLKYRRRK